MTDHATSTDRRLGDRYRVDEPDGTWWELGWDRPLGTFYAQHHTPLPYDPFTPDDPLAWHGTDLDELPTVESLAARLPIAIPDDVANDLKLDAAAYPRVADPPFLAAARRLTATVDRMESPGDGDGDDGAARFASRQPDTEGREGRLTDSSPTLQRWSLPAEPLAIELHGLRADRYLADDDIGTFARGLGIDPHLAQGVLSGTVEQLTIEQIAEVCEALRCSPYDVWGPEMGRAILHAYGPESWPRHIEPLDDGRRLPSDDEFLRRRIDQQARSITSLDGTIPSVGRGSAILEATRFRQTGVLAVDPTGASTRVEDDLQPADQASDYHFTFRQLRAPQFVEAPLTSAAFSEGCPAGHEVDPRLAALADRLDRSDPGADMIRLVDPSTGAEQWIGRETPFEEWQTWDDPRRYYPGDPADVLDTAGLADRLGPGDPELVFETMDGSPSDLTDRAPPAIEPLSLDF